MDIYPNIYCNTKFGKNTKNQLSDGKCRPATTRNGFQIFNLLPESPKNIEFKKQFLWTDA